MPGERLGARGENGTPLLAWPLSVAVCQRICSFAAISPGSAEESRPRPFRILNWNFPRREGHRMPVPGVALEKLGFLTIGLFDGASPGAGHEVTLATIE